MSQCTRQTVIVLGQCQSGPDSTGNTEMETSRLQILGVNAKYQDNKLGPSPIFLGGKSVDISTLPALSKVCAEGPCHWNKLFVAHEPWWPSRQSTEQRCVHLSCRAHTSAPEPPATDVAMQHMCSSSNLDMFKDEKTWKLWNSVLTSHFISNTFYCFLAELRSTMEFCLLAPGQEMQK